MIKTRNRQRNPVLIAVTAPILFFLLAGCNNGGAASDDKSAAVANTTEGGKPATAPPHPLGQGTK